MNNVMPTTTPAPANMFRRAAGAARNEGSMNSSNKEVSKLLTAAVVSKAFCQLLLTNPAQALEDGYNGMRFALTSQEKELLLSIQASSLPELATQFTSRNGEGMGPTTRLATPLMQV